MLRDDSAGAEAVGQKMVSDANPVAVMFGRNDLFMAYAYEGRIGKVLEQQKLGLDLARKGGVPPSIVSFLLPIAYVHRITGNYQDALNEIAEAIELAGKAENPGLERAALRFRGLVEVATKSLDQAERTAEELKTLCEQSPNPREIRLYLMLRGVVELERKDYARAVADLEQAISLAPSAMPRYWDMDAMAALADAYSRSGDNAKALEQYQKIASRPTAKLNNPIIYAMAYYESGKICQEMGLKDRARENFRRFLSLWKNADPGRPELADAMKRLAAL
jgi:tetratricopeptide (TPR) repeat protein